MKIKSVIQSTIILILSMVGAKCLAQTVFKRQIGNTATGNPSFSTPVNKFTGDHPSGNWTVSSRTSFEFTHPQTLEELEKKGLSPESTGEALSSGNWQSRTVVRYEKDNVAAETEIKRSSEQWDDGDLAAIIDSGNWNVTTKQGY